jgi:hypothetical protein
VKLVPLRPPGSNDRKARAFAADIRVLREQGHTFESIREALAAAGVHVSNSTVQREVARARRELPDVPALPRRSTQESAPSPAAALPQRPAPPPHPLDRADGRSSKEIAEAFARNQITNPLILAQRR